MCEPQRLDGSPAHTARADEHGTAVNPSGFGDYIPLPPLWIWLLLLSGALKSSVLQV